MQSTRDVTKLLTTKQYYNKSNVLMYNNPHLHRVAIASGFKSEQVTHLAEDILRATVANRDESYDLEMLQQ